MMSKALLDADALLDKEIDRYMKRFRKALALPPVLVAQHTENVRNEINGFLYALPEAGIAEIHEEFGTPETFAKMIMDEKPEAVIQRGRWFRILRRVVAIALVLMSAAIVIFFILFLREFNRPTASYARQSFFIDNGEIIV